MYGTTGTSLGGGLAVTGLSVGSHILAGIGLLFAGISFMMLARKSSPVRP